MTKCRFVVEDAEDTHIIAEPDLISYRAEIRAQAWANRNACVQTAQRINADLKVKNLAFCQP